MTVSTNARRIDPAKYPALSKYAAPLPPPGGTIVGREREVTEVLASLLRPRLSNLLLLAPPGSGKLLPLTMPVPTPTGWTTMGDLSVGDEVLGQDGRPTRVTFLSEIDESPELYDLTFSDGSVIRACADHQWKVSTRSQREAGYPSRSSRTAELRSKDRARNDALVALAEEYGSVWLTAEEFLDVVRSADVPGWTWNKAVGLDTYLRKNGAVHREGTRELPKRYGGVVTGTKTGKVREYQASSAFLVMAEQRRRHKTWAADGSVAESVMTTRGLIENGVRIQADDRTNFAVRVAEPLDLPEAELPMDPYSLGVWLGDGHRRFNNRALVTSMDPEVIERMCARSGYVARGEVYREDSQALLYRVDGLGVDLSAAGIDRLAEKRIPTVFLRGSYEQRLELLRGLLDTDGFIDEKGAIELTFSGDLLARGAEELIRTLGIKVTRKVSEGGYTDESGTFIRCQDRHRMHFTTDLPVFTLPRRLEKLPATVRKTQKLLYIESIERAPSEPGRCIQVDNDDHMYLAGEGFVPTHNTVLVQEAMTRDVARVYLEMDLARLQGGVGAHQMAGELKTVFDELERYSKEEGHEIVLFIDELHQIVQMDAAAVEALKPILASSGARGLKIIGATTFDEWVQYIRPNKPLDERLQRVNLDPAGRDMTIKILRTFAEEEGVGDQFASGDGLLGQIHDLTNLHVPSSVQPRSSIGILDGMIGWHRLTGERMDFTLLTKVMRQVANIDIGFTIDGRSLKAELDRRVYSQKMATTILANQLQVVAAGLNDPTRPKGSFLLSGSTGVGKSNACSNPVAVTDHSADGVRWKIHGELEVGDFVFDRTGRPTEVLGVFPQGVRDIYRVTLSDGRSLDVDGEHLWSVYTAKQRSNKHAGRGDRMTNLTTLEMLERGVVRTYSRDEREHLKFFVPMNGAAQWPEAKLEVDPYSVGALLGNGSLRMAPLTISSADEGVVVRIAESFGVAAKKASGANYDWTFVVGRYGTRDKVLQTKDALASVPELIGRYSRDRRIPKAYLTGSTEQRWELVRGLFDTDGTVDSSTGRFNVSYSTFSEGLAQDLRQLLFSLGVSSSLNCWTRTKVDADGKERELVEYHVHVKVADEGKPNFFWLPRKREVAERAAASKSGRTRVKKFDMVGIKSIEKLAEPAEAVCILVDNDEHLYQAGEHFVVTHNTELTKQLVNLVMGQDSNRFIRFDMSEFAIEESMEVFRSELTKKVVSLGHAVILLDEIEKAHFSVVRLLLQVLDDARLTDDNGRQVSFHDSYIVLTTNAGNEVYKTIAAFAEDDEGSGEKIKEFMPAIENSLRANKFPPELLGRLDKIIPFQPLSTETKRLIVARALKKLQSKVLDLHGVQLGIKTDDVLDYLTVDMGKENTDAGGAREAVRMVQGEITEEVARFINAHPEAKRLRLYIEGSMRARDTSLISSEARPKVEARLR